MKKFTTIALVTGATRGIGKAIAKALSATDTYIIGTATSEQGAEVISTYFDEDQINGEGRVFNAGSFENTKTLISEISDAFGYPSILINNAGITKDQLLLRMKEEDWDDVIDINLKSVYRLSRLCLKGMMKNRWGRIINIGSVVGSIGNAGQSNYSASKSAIEGFTRSLAREIGMRGITVNTVAPGFIETDMTLQLDEDVRAKMLEKIPLARLGQPKDVASVVKFLASSSGEYITGETIHVNGGLYMG
ncbi:MAG: 3-oxoacyl-ACP reductase FabG [SAR92 clade bacterium]|uniref:3-oxoacyl-[acyl-carrier-protein] reductase n=1 Tax=SAR92 clade bacterium TaxID=2315479 RepID=A0A520LNC8_9GAMM|nr:MAG: 3-oxoacyl-ACP reductase FabG [SAR92 clade bacterium]|tara:strand:+ start:1186 stop:1929 length:744 start_codon:yes stop_codon:yes gene_type:complete